MEHEVIQNMSFYLNLCFCQLIDDLFSISAPKISKSDFGINWDHLSSQDVYNLWRGISDVGKLFSHWQESNAIVRFQDIIHPDIIKTLDITNSDNYYPGETVSIKRGPDRFICIKCNSGWTSFKKFYYEQKKVMTATEFHNGFFSKTKRKERFFRTKDGVK